MPKARLLDCWSAVSTYNEAVLVPVMLILNWSSFVV